jgi:hypothetical protein
MKCPFCDERWDRDFIWTDVEGDIHTERVKRFQELGCNAFRDGWDIPCGAPAPTPLADFMRRHTDKEVQA